MKIMLLNTKNEVVAELKPTIVTHMTHCSIITWREVHYIYDYRLNNADCIFYSEAGTRFRATDANMLRIIEESN